MPKKSGRLKEPLNTRFESPDSAVACTSTTVLSILSFPLMHYWIQPNVCTLLAFFYINSSPTTFYVLPPPIYFSCPLTLFYPLQFTSIIFNTTAVQWRLKDGGGGKEWHTRGKDTNQCWRQVFCLTTHPFSCPTQFRISAHDKTGYSIARDRKENGGSGGGVDPVRSTQSHTFHPSIVEHSTPRGAAKLTQISQRQLSFCRQSLPVLTKWVPH